MSAYELRDFGILLAVTLVPSVLLAFVLLRVRPAWTQRTIVWVSAMPIPAVIVLVCAFVFFNALTTSREACGVDACGMAMAFSIILVGYALAAFGVAALVCWLVCRWYRR